MSNTKYARIRQLWELGRIKYGRMYTYEEIARKVNVSVSTVQREIRRMREAYVA